MSSSYITCLLSFHGKCGTQALNKKYIYFYSKILCSPLDNLVYYCRLPVSLGHFLNSHRSLIPSEGVGVVGSMFAGSFAGTAEHIIMYPVDSVKVLIPGLDSRWIFSGWSKGFQSKRLRTSFVQWEAWLQGGRKKVVQMTWQCWIMVQVRPLHVTGSSEERSALEMPKIKKTVSASWKENWHLFSTKTIIS